MEWTREQVEISERFGQLLEMMLDGEDKEGVMEAGRDLGIVDEEERLAINEEDELNLLLDYYFFACEVDGTTRVEVALDAPPEKLNEEQRALLPALRETRMGFFEYRRNGHFRDLRTQEELAIIPDGLPKLLVDECIFLRIFQHEGTWYHTHLPYKLHNTLKKFLREPGATEELAHLLPMGKAQLTEPLSLYRAVYAGLVAQELSAERGSKMRLPKKKRSLGRTKRRKR